MNRESAKDAAETVSGPIMRRQRVKDGDRYILTCPVRGTVHSPMSWFYLPMSQKETINLTATALSEGAFMTVGTPSAWLALHAKQVNLSSLLADSRGRISIDPAYHLIYAEAKSGTDAAQTKDGGRLPVFRLACVHGDARGHNFKWSDWSGIQTVETIVRWSHLQVLTGLATAVSVLMPAFLSVATVLLGIKCIMDERKPEMQAAALGRTPRPKI